MLPTDKKIKFELLCNLFYKLQDIICEKDKFLELDLIPKEELEIFEKILEICKNIDKQISESNNDNIDDIFWNHTIDELYWLKNSNNS